MFVWNFFYCLKFISFIVSYHILDLVFLLNIFEYKDIGKKKKRKKNSWNGGYTLPCFKNKNNDLDASHLTKFPQDSLRKTGDGVHGIIHFSRWW